MASRAACATLAEGYGAAHQSAHPPVAGDTDLTLAELTGIDVDVVGFRAESDAERDLWYSDVQIAADRHEFPCVRMALARFQPISVAGAHVSLVVLSDFVQLLPQRQVEYDLNQVGGTGLVPLRVRGRPGSAARPRRASPRP